MNPVTRILRFCQFHDIQLVSYGLAPNPNGFCYERSKHTPAEACKLLEIMLETLTAAQTEELKAKVFQ